jgi:hypothetical protein
MTIGHQSVELSPSQTSAPSIAECNFKADWLAPHVLRATFQLASGVVFCALLIPYMHYSRTNMSVECEACKSNALAEYENKLAQCEFQTTTKFSLAGGGTFGLNCLEVLTIMAASCAWQYLTWLFQDQLVTRIGLRKGDKKA